MISTLFNYFPKSLVLETNSLVARAITSKDFEIYNSIVSDLTLLKYSPSFNPNLSLIENNKKMFESILEDESKSNKLTLAFLNKETNEYVQTSSFYDFNESTKNVFIGYTITNHKFKRSFVNRTAKWLMMKYAFETAGVEKVTFSIDNRNEASKKGVASIGGFQEGVLRHHMYLKAGYIRDTAIYGILKKEWPEAERKVLAYVR